MATAFRAALTPLSSERAFAPVRIAGAKLLSASGL
jgi:hypothetical protein